MRRYQHAPLRGVARPFARRAYERYVWVKTIIVVGSNWKFWTLLVEICAATP
jgi:hypothetical protein